MNDMNKRSYLFLILLILVLFTSCSRKDNSIRTQLKNEIIALDQSIESAEFYSETPDVFNIEIVLSNSLSENVRNKTSTEILSLFEDDEVYSYFQTNILKVMGLTLWLFI